MFHNCSFVRKMVLLFALLAVICAGTKTGGPSIKPDTDKMSRPAAKRRHRMPGSHATTAPSTGAKTALAITALATVVSGAAPSPPPTHPTIHLSKDEHEDLERRISQMTMFSHRGMTWEEYVQHKKDLKQHWIDNMQACEAVKQHQEWQCKGVHSKKDLDCKFLAPSWDTMKMRCKRKQ